MLTKTYLYLFFFCKTTLLEFKLVRKSLAWGAEGAWKNGITFNVCDKQVWEF